MDSSETRHTPKKVLFNGDRSVAVLLADKALLPSGFLSNTLDSPLASVAHMCSLDSNSLDEARETASAALEELKHGFG